MVFVAVENGFSLYKGMATFGASFLWSDAAEWRVKALGFGSMRDVWSWRTCGAYRYMRVQGVTCIVEKRLLQRSVFNVNGKIVIDMFCFLLIQCCSIEDF